MSKVQSLTESKTVLKNFSVLTFCNIFSQFLMLFISIKIARSISPVQFGMFNLLQLHVAILAILASLGLRNIIIRNVARNKQTLKKIFYGSIILRSIAMTLIIIIFSFYYHHKQTYENILFLLVVISLVLTVLSDLFES